MAPEGGSLMIPLTITSDLELFCTVFVQASLQLSRFICLTYFTLVLLKTIGSPELQIVFIVFILKTLLYKFPNFSSQVSKRRISTFEEVRT